MSSSERFSPPNTVEQAVEMLLGQALSAFNIPIYTSDMDTTKAAPPFIVIEATNCIEAISPGCGIFDAIVEIRLTSHVKQTPSAGRDDIIKAIYDTAYDSPIAQRLSQMENFHCYGWQDKGAKFTVDQERKTYVNILTWKIVFMPRDNN